MYFKQIRTQKYAQVKYSLKTSYAQQKFFSHFLKKIC